MAKWNHYPPKLDNLGAGAVIIDHFGVPFMVIELNAGQGDNYLVDLDDGCSAENTDVACPWKVVDRTEVKL